MDRIEKLNKLENIKQQYILLRNYALYCKTIIDSNKLQEEKTNEYEYVKKLVLTKPYYGKQLIVG